LPDARDILDELTKRNVKLSLGGSIHDPTDPVGRLLFNVARYGRRVRIRPDPDADPGGDEGRQSQRPAARQAAEQLSHPMVEKLRTKADEAAIPVANGDMATARVPGEYVLVYLVYNAISNLLTQAEQVACFRNAARHLTSDGRFVIELWVPELRKLPPGQQATVWHTEPGYIGLDTYDVLAQHVISHHFRFGEGRQAEVFRSPHRYIWPAEVDLMAQHAGFELETRHADWAGTEFTAESRSHVSVYRIPPLHL
jgi:hypothetical protein